MPHAKKLWIVVADGEHARFLTLAEDRALQTIETLDSASAHQRSADLGTERPGRVFESAGTTRHAVSPRQDPQAAEKQKFAYLIAHQLATAQARGAFGQLVLVAPDHVLADLRDALDAACTEKLVGTLAKDLVKVPNAELQPHLEEWVRPVVRK